MWGCNWGYPFAAGGWFPAHGVWGIFLSIVLIAAIVSLVLFVFRSIFGKSHQHKDRRDSIEILKAKFASGAITEEEFIKMRDLLTQ